MLNTLMIKWIVAGLLSIALSGGIYAGYYHIKQIGFDEASAIYEEREALARASLEGHIHTLEVLSKTVVDNNVIYMGKLDSGIKSILDNVSGKPPYVVIDGKCAPSESFVQTYNSIIGAANE